MEPAVRWAWRPRGLLGSFHDQNPFHQIIIYVYSIYIIYIYTMYVYIYLYIFKNGLGLLDDYLLHGYYFNAFV